MFFSRHSADISGNGSTAPVLTEPPVPITHERHTAAGEVVIYRPRQRRHVHAEAGAVSAIHRIAFVPMPATVRRLLDPRVRFGGSIDASAFARRPG